MTSSYSWLALLLSLVGVSYAEEREPRTVFNDDAQMLMETPKTGATKFVKAWLDREIEAVPFSTYVFLAATPDICTYESKAGETYADRLGPDYPHSWAPGIRALRAEGTDVLKVVTEHMRACGKEVLAAIRMNDTHHTHIGHTHPLCPQFTIDNPQFVIKQPDGRTNETALDYSHPEVREHRLGIMREIVEGYDVDGLELNFVRWAKHFPRDKGREKAPIMTQFVGRIRAMMDEAAEKRGRKRPTLGVRVPESLAACMLAGVDVEAWVERGWIDYVVISTWNNTDPQLPVAEFTRFTKPAGVDTIVVMGNMIGTIYAGPPTMLDRPVAMSAKHANGYQGMLLTASEARGAAANYYTEGADSISFWNVGIHFGSAATATAEQQARIARWTQAVRSMESVFAGPRTYRYLPMGKGMSSRKPPVRNYPWYDEGRTPLGHICSPVLTFDKERIGKRQVFPFRMADGRNGEKLTGRMTFWAYHLAAADDLKLDINGESIDDSVIERFPNGKRRGGLPGQRFEISLADCPPFRGRNELGLTLESESTAAHSPYVEELEVVVENDVKSALVKPKSVRKVVSNGRHNAFAAFNKWKGQYWLAFREGTGHVARDGDMVVLRSKDTRDWTECVKLDVAGDDRDAQLLPTENRLFLYINSLHEGKFDVRVTYTDDGETWSEPQRVYRDGYILWKPIEKDGRFYAGAHRPGPNNRRISTLATSTDGIQWDYVADIRSGQGESETTLLFDGDRLIAFLRSQITVGGLIMESSPPYKEWTQRPAGAHLSGHSVYTFDGVTYLVSRLLSYNPPIDPNTPRAEVGGRKLDQATMVYTYEDGRLNPYCRLGPLDGNHDSSYAEVVRDGDDMLVIYHRAEHVFGGEFRAKDAADLFLARVPLKRAVP